MEKMPTFIEAINESVSMVGNMKVEKMNGGWKLSVPSQMGRGVQVVVLTDEQVPELIKILTNK